MHPFDPPSSSRPTILIVGYRAYSELDRCLASLAMHEPAVPVVVVDHEADLEAVVRAVHQSLVANPVGWSLPALGLDLSRDPELGRDYRRRIIEPPREQAIRLVRAGQGQGRFDAAVDAETLVDAVGGIWAFRQLVGLPPPPVEDVVAVVRASLHICPTRGRRRSPR